MSDVRQSATPSTSQHSTLCYFQLTSSEFFVGGQSYLSLPNNTFYTRPLMETIIGRDPTRKFHAFAQQFNALGLGDAEVAVLCCIQLTAPGHGTFYVVILYLERIHPVIIFQLI